MKKILALLLSLLMLLSSAAMAEGAGKTAAVLRVSNITGEIGYGSQTQSLGDFAMTVILDAAGDPTFLFNADHGGEKLTTLAARLDAQGRVFVTYDGADATYTGDLATLLQSGAASQLAGALPELPGALRQMIPLLDEAVLPAFTGVTIPKLDVDALLSDFVTGENNGVTTFSIPYETFAGLLDTVSAYAGMMGGQTSSIDQLASAIDGLKTGGSGLAVSGDIMDIDDKKSVVFNVLPVNGGVTAETPLFVLFLETAENMLSLAAGPSRTEPVQIMITVESDPSVPRLDVFLNTSLTGDSSHLTFSLRPDDSLQAVDFFGKFGSSEFETMMTYGREDDKDALTFYWKSGEAYAWVYFKTEKGSDGVRTGTVSFSPDGMSQFSEGTTISADLEMYLADAAPVEIAWPAAEKDLSELNDSVHAAAFAPMNEYLMSQYPES